MRCPFCGVKLSEHDTTEHGNRRCRLIGGADGRQPNDDREPPAGGTEPLCPVCRVPAGEHDPGAECARYLPKGAIRYWRKSDPADVHGDVAAIYSPWVAVEKPPAPIEDPCAVEALGAMASENARLVVLLREAEAENSRLRAAAPVDRLKLEAAEASVRSYEVEVRGLIMSLLDANEEIARLKAQVRHLIDQRNHARSRMGWVIREARNYKRRIDFDMHLRMSPPPGGAAPPADRGDAEDAH